MGRKNEAGRVPVAPTDERRSGVTLGALFSKAGLVPPPPARPTPAAGAPSPAPAAPPPAPDLAGADLATVAKLVVRRERKGHGGHTATVVEGLAATGVDATEVARRLKRALGCGATLEGGAIVVQGDVPDRVAAWLEGQGVRRVVRGN